MAQSPEKLTTAPPASPPSRRGLLLLRNTLVSATSATFAQLLALATFPLLIRQVGPTDYGIFSLASAAVGYFAIVNLAARASVVKYTAEFNETDRESLRSFFTNAVLINSLLGLFIATSLVLLAIFCHKLFSISPSDIPRARQILLINAIAIVITQPLTVFGSLLYGFQRYSLVASLDMIWTFTRNAVIVGMFFFDGSIFWLVWEEILIQFIKFTALAFIVRKKYPFISISTKSLKWTIIKRIFSYGGWSVVYTVAFVMVYQGSIILTGIILSIAAITSLQIAYKIYNLINTVALYLSSAVLPSSSAAIAAGDEQYLKNLIMSGSKTYLSVLLPITITTIFFTPEIINLWMGQEYVGSAGIVSRILALSWLILSPTIFLTQIYFGQKDIAKLAFSTFLGTVGFTLLSILLARHFDLIGIAWACSFFYIYVGITGFILILRKFQISWKTFFNKVFYSTYGINLVCAAILGVSYLFIGPPKNILGLLVYFFIAVISGISFNLLLNARQQSLSFLRHVIDYIFIFLKLKKIKFKMFQSYRA